jgi:hypothetical protein
MAPFGVNGGVGAGTEEGALPQAGGNNYIQFVSGTKNLYGTIEITDKSIQASQNNEGAFVNLLNSELEGLMRGSKFNVGRMLFGDGSGKLATCKVNDAVTLVAVDSAQFLIEGQTIDILHADGSAVDGGTKRRILAVDRTPTAPKILLDGATKVTTIATDVIYVQGSKDLELTGLGKIFSTDDLYGVKRSENYWMVPYTNAINGVISDIKIQKGIDYINDIIGGDIDYISCSSGVKRSYQEYMEATKRNVNTMKLEGGFTSLSYNGIPLVSDRFEGAGNLRLLSTKDYTLHHMGDWRWMGQENGKVLTQVAGYPKWTATLVKYAELICRHPGAQGLLSGITEDDGTA